MKKMIEILLKYCGITSCLMNSIFAFVEITILLGKQVNNVNKLTLKYQNAYEILNNFITEYNKNFLRLKEYFKKRY